MLKQLMNKPLKNNFKISIKINHGSVGNDSDILHNEIFFCTEKLRLLTNYYNYMFMYTSAHTLARSLHDVSCAFSKKNSHSRSIKCQPRANNKREAVVVRARHVVKRPSKRMRASILLKRN